MLSIPAAVLLAIAAGPGITVEEIGARIRTSTRTVRRAITLLEEAGVLTRSRIGNHNEYEIHLDQRVRLLRDITVSDFLARMS